MQPSPFENPLSKLILEIFWLLIVMEFFLFFKIAKKITPENEMLFAFMNFDNRDYGRNGFTSLPEGETCFL